MAPNDATPGHWINVLLYALTGFVLFSSLLKISSGNILFSFITSILFIAHPVHTEVVASIKSRDEIMAFLFSIWALERYINYVRSKKILSLVIASFLFFVALLSKESAITFLAIFPLTAYFFTDEKIAVSLKSLIPIAIVTGIFLIIRSSILGGISSESFSVADNLLEAAKDPITKFSTTVLIMGLYLKILLFPHPLVFDYSYNQIPLVGAGSPGFIASALFYGGMLIFSFWKLKSKNLFAYSILFSLLPYLYLLIFSLQ
ncbi:MAG: DUF1736 domain-containing protein [Bacteroidetes bacterium]|nr:DUF1736 domain-containing protein [Bacteroidota bacterium]